MTLKEGGDLYLPNLLQCLSEIAVLLVQEQVAECRNLRADTGLAERMYRDVDGPFLLHNCPLLELVVCAERKRSGEALDESAADALDEYVARRCNDACRDPGTVRYPRSR